MTHINLFDRTLKIIGRNYADLLLRLAFPDIPAQLVGTLENVELSLPVRPVDFVHRIEHAGQEYLLHIEFQLEHKADFPRRMHSYHGALTEQFKLPVLTLALYLRPRSSPLPDEYTVCLGDRVVNRFSYPVLRLWDYVEEIRSGQYRQLAPLLVTLVQTPDEHTLNEERELIMAEPADRKRADLLALAVTVASRYFDKAFLWQFFREEVEQMRESSLVEDWILEGIEQGIERGIEQGRRKGIMQAQRETILQILHARFNLHPRQVEPLARRLEAIDDPTRLKKLVEHALRDVTLTDFNTRLQDIQPVTAEQPLEQPYLGG